MIIKNTHDLKILVNSLKNSLSVFDISVKQQRLYEIFAQSVGFKSDNALRYALPVYVDSSAADSAFQYLVKKYSNTIDKSILLKTYLYSNEISSLDIFPVIANHQQHVKFLINWQNRGTISKPYLVHDSEKGVSDFDDFYGNKTSFNLGLQVDEFSFNQLIDRIKSLVDSVVLGFEFVGSDQKPSLTELAIQAHEEIDEIIEQFVLELDQYVLRTAPEYFGDGFPWLDDIDSSGHISVEFEGTIILDHATTDLEIRQLVAIELLNDDGIRDHFLYSDLMSYRDTCITNYELLSNDAVSS
jgi:hypothetical protein